MELLKAALMKFHRVMIGLMGRAGLAFAAFAASYPPL